MKILILAPFGEGFLANSYTNALEKMEHEVYKFNSVEAYFSSSILARHPVSRRLFRKILWEKLNFTSLELIKTIKPDLVITFKGAYLNPDTIYNIKIRYGVPVVNYYPDNPYCGVPLNPRKTSAQRRDIVECLRECSIVFTWSRILADKLRSDKVNSSYLPFGTDQEFYNHAPVPNKEIFNQKHDVVLVGLINKKRQKHLKNIRNHKVDVWGVGWERATKEVTMNHNIHLERAFGRDCSALYKNAKVSLNVVDDLNIPGHNMRTFEIPASKGLMLSVYTNEQNEFFPEEEAAFYYRNLSELDKKLNFILDNPSLTATVRENGYRLSLDHTYHKRAAEMLSVIDQL